MAVRYLRQTCTLRGQKSTWLNFTLRKVIYIESDGATKNAYLWRFRVGGACSRISYAGETWVAMCAPCKRDRRVQVPKPALLTPCDGCGMMDLQEELGNGSPSDCKSPLVEYIGSNPISSTKSGKCPRNNLLKGKSDDYIQSKKKYFSSQRFNICR
jgi:hypothetical protein